MKQAVSRRSILKGALVSGAAFSLSASSYSRVLGANSKLRVASVGTGGKGWGDLTGVAASPSVDIVAVCDIDSSKEHLGRAVEKFPQAKSYADWRKLVDSPKDFDGIIVSTPDHMHAPISLAAMHSGKHVFCQKPLSHTVHESRQMQLAAQKYKLTTQMCNQIQSHSVYRTAVSWVHAGVLGKVKEVHSWQSGSPTWRAKAIPRNGSDPVPTTVNWDLWQGVAPETEYKTELYHPFNWRGWQHYGTGQLGDFGCHILDPVFKALKLTAPTSLRVDAPELPSELWTDRCTVYYQFPGTEYTAGESIPVTWYDKAGGIPDKEQFKHLPADAKLPSAGSVLVGEKGSLVIPHVAEPKFYSASGDAPQLETLPSVDHYTQWADACLGVGETTSHFDYASPLTEAVLLGTVGVRFPGQELKWDAKSEKITNVGEANQFLTKEYRKGWEPAWV